MRCLSSITPIFTRELKEVINAMRHSFQFFSKEDNIMVLFFRNVLTSHSITMLRSPVITWPKKTYMKFDVLVSC